MNLLIRLIKHELVSGSLFIFIGSALASFLAFLLNLFFARSLSYADYGIFASLIAIIILASIPAASINTILVKFSADYYSKKEMSKLKAFYKKAFKFIFSFSSLFLLSFIIFSPLITNFLHLDNILYVIVAGFCVWIGYIQIVNAGFLQGLMKFSFLSFVNCFSGVIKIVFGVLFVMLGFRAYSGLGAIFFMGLGAFLIELVPLRAILSKKDEDKLHIPTKEVINYAFPAFITVLFMSSFTSVDVILVKHFFDSHTAGFYAGLSLIGRVIFYFTAPIPVVMFPLLIRRHNLGKNFNNLFYLALLLVLLPSIAITLFYFLFPHFVINLFLGGRGYLSVAQYIGLFGINLTLFSLINVCVNFFLSLNKTKIAPLVAIAALSQVFLIYIFHSSFYQVIGVSISIFLVLLVILIIYYLKIFVDTKKIINSLPFFNNPTI